MDVGSYLSGGMDSSTIASLARALSDDPIHTFSGGFHEGASFDETPYARLVSEHLQTLHHEIFPTATDLPDLLPGLIYHRDEPAAGPGLLPQYAVSIMASHHVKVVLGGQGGDEVFGGYTRYLVAYLEECLRGGIEGTQADDDYVVTFASILPNLQQLRGYQPLMQHFFSEGLFDAPTLRYFRLIDRSSAISHLVNSDLLHHVSRTYSPFETYRTLFESPDVTSYINKMTRFDMLTMLPALLQVEDRTSMAVSLESRVPLLDHRIAELVASMPPKIKYKGGRSKHVFREVVRDVLPPVINERQDKMGFPVPLTKWYKERSVRAFLYDTLTSRTAVNRGLFHRQEVVSLLDSEHAYGRSVWGLLSLELWAQTFLDRYQVPSQHGHVHTLVQKRVA